MNLLIQRGEKISIHLENVLDLAQILIQLVLLWHPWYWRENLDFL